MTQGTAKTICVTFVCSANTCRSPMLKYMFASYVKNANQEFENLNKICCFSAGLASSICPMAENAKAVLKKRNIQFVDSLSQEINEEIFAFSNFVFCMNDEILKAVESKFCDINLKNINSQFCDINLKNINSQVCDINKKSKPTGFDSVNDGENVPKVLNSASFDSTKNDGENVPKILNLAAFNNGVEIFDPYGMNENAYETVANIFDNIIPKIYKFVLND